MSSDRSVLVEGPSLPGESSGVGGVLRLVLNRPDRRNALSPETCTELLQALQAARTNVDVRVVVITGAGALFSAGGDLSQMSAAADLPASFAELLVGMHTLGKPIVARVNGHALGGGLGLVVACDIAVASRDARLGMPEIHVGLWPMMITAEVVRSVGRKQALDLMLTGRQVSADEAATLGLVTRAVDASALDAEVDRITAELAARSPVALRMGLQAFYNTQDMDHGGAVDHLHHQLAALLATDDAREGIQAFLAKRPPVWKGK